MVDVLGRHPFVAQRRAQREVDRLGDRRDLLARDPLLDLVDEARAEALRGAHHARRLRLRDRVDAAQPPRLRRRRADAVDAA